MSNLFRYVWILLALPVLVFLLPISPSADLRNAVGLKLMQTGQPGPAKMVYAIGKTYKEPMSTNNWQVLEYRRLRLLPNQSKSEKRDLRLKARADFDAVGEDGLAAGFYNAAMICFKCGYKTTGYRKAVERLKRAIELGDPHSEDALALLQKTDKTIPEHLRTQKLADAANGGNPVAARYLANKVYKQRTPPYEYEKFMLIAANGGIPDAQAMAADIKGQDRVHWLQQAASAKLNRNIRAGVDLAYHYENIGNFKEARKWMSIAGQPREDFNTKIDIRKDGLRWRGQRTTRIGDHGFSYIAASTAAGMKIAGLGGRKDTKGAQEHIDYALRYKYGDFAKILTIINAYAGEPIPESVMIRANMDALRKDFVARNRTAVKPLLENGTAQYFTPYHFYSWLKDNTEKGLPTSLFAERNFAKLRERCRTQKCFLLTRETTLPDTFFGGHAVTFVVPADVPAPKSASDHNTYIFLGENQNKRVQR